MSALDILHLSHNPQGGFIVMLGIVTIGAITAAFYLMGRP